MRSSLNFSLPPFLHTHNLSFTHNLAFIKNSRSLSSSPPPPSPRSLALLFYSFFLSHSLPPFSGEHKRTIGRPKIHGLNKQGSELWTVRIQITYYINRTDCSSGSSQKKISRSVFFWKFLPTAHFVSFQNLVCSAICCKKNLVCRAFYFDVLFCLPIH